MAVWTGDARDTRPKADFGDVFDGLQVSLGYSVACCGLDVGIEFLGGDAPGPRGATVM
jgi:hypothetical protein